MPMGDWPDSIPKLASSAAANREKEAYRQRTLAQVPPGLLLQIGEQSSHLNNNDSTNTRLNLQSSCIALRFDKARCTNVVTDTCSYRNVIWDFS